MVSRDRGSSDINRWHSQSLVPSATEGCLPAAGGTGAFPSCSAGLSPRFVGVPTVGVYPDEVGRGREARHLSLPGAARKAFRECLWLYGGWPTRPACAARLGRDEIGTVTRDTSGVRISPAPPVRLTQLSSENCYPT